MVSSFILLHVEYCYICIILYNCILWDFPFRKLCNMATLPTSDCIKAQLQRLSMTYNIRGHRAPAKAISDQDRSAQRWIKAPDFLSSCCFLCVQLPRQGMMTQGRNLAPEYLLQPQQILKLGCRQRGELLTSLQTALYYHIPTQGGLTATQSHNVTPRPAAEMSFFPPQLRWQTEPSSPRGG